MRIVREILLALIVAAFVRTAVAESYQVPTGSMVPTLLEGDELIAAKYAYGYSRFSLPIDELPAIAGRLLNHAPQRGDVVVFRLPRDPAETYVKRLIGLPGDRIRMRQGELIINGVVVRRVRLGSGEMEFHGQTHLVDRYTETLPGGVTHEIIKLGNNMPLDETNEITVPSHHYFMMGDNRDDSLDSRVSEKMGGVGFVPEDNLVGRVDRLAYSRDLARPWWDMLNGPRLSRMFASIH